MPPLPSVTSACEGPRSCTWRYSSALLPKIFDRPGPKSVRPAMYCSGVKVVVLCRRIVDIASLLSVPETPGILILAKSGGDELLSAVDVIGCTCEGCVGHNVHGERGHVRRSDHASDGKGGAKLVAAFFELIAQQFG